MPLLALQLSHTFCFHTISISVLQRPANHAKVPYCSDAPTRATSSQRPPSPVELPCKILSRSSLRYHSHSFVRGGACHREYSSVSATDPCTAACRCRILCLSPSCMLQLVRGSMAVRRATLSARQLLVLLQCQWCAVIRDRLNWDTNRCLLCTMI
jgi:hypothetical protein